MLLLAMLQMALVAAVAPSAASSSSDSANVTFVVAAASASSSSGSNSSSEDATPAPIDTATGSSSTFQLVESQTCNETVADFIYLVYNKNTALFDTCVNEAQYQVFPYLGTHPSAAQIYAMATSRPCIAVFTGVERAGLPQCDISGMPLRAAVETLLKIAIDVEQDLEDPPSAERFQYMMGWRRDVNLATAAGVPDDSDSELYSQYKANLAVALADTTIRVLEDYTIIYQLDNGVWTSDGTTTFTALGSGSGSNDVVGTVNAGDSDDTSSQTDADVGDDSEADSASASSSGSSAAASVVLSTPLLVGALLLVSMLA